VSTFLKKIVLPPLPMAGKDAQHAFFLFQFNLTRARLIRQRGSLTGVVFLPPGTTVPLPSGPRGKLQDVELPANMVGARLLEPAEWEGGVELSLESSEEELEPVARMALVNGEATLHASLGNPCLDSGKVFQVELPDGVPLLTPAVYLELTGALLGLGGAMDPLTGLLVGALPDSLRNQYRRFFFDLDRETEGTLGALYVSSDDWQLRLGDLVSVRGGLVERIKRRFAERQAGTHYAAIPCSSSVANSAILVSELLVGLLKEHFPDGAGGIDFTGVEEAFEMFANGELRLQLPAPYLAWTTQPSSNFYFLFAELALLCVENGIDTGVWEPLIPALVRTQLIYVEVYPPVDKATAQLGQGTGCAFVQGAAWTCSQKAKLRADFATMDTHALAEAAAQHALDNIGGMLIP